MSTIVSTRTERTSAFAAWASTWIRISIPAFVGIFCITVTLAANVTLTLCLLALYGREVEEEEGEDEEEEQLEVRPDLLFRNAPQLLQYTAALRSRQDGDDDHDEDASVELDIQRERRRELRLDSHIGTAIYRVINSLYQIFLLNIKNRKLLYEKAKCDFTLCFFYQCV